MADLTNRRTVSKCTLDMKTLHTENLKTHKKRVCSTSMHCFVILQTEIENKLWFIHQNNGHDDRHCKTIRRKTSAKPKLKNKTDSMGFKHTPCIIIRNNPSHRTILWMRTGWQSCTTILFTDIRTNHGTQINKHRHNTTHPWKHNYDGNRIMNDHLRQQRCRDLPDCHNVRLIDLNFTPKQAQPCGMRRLIIQTRTKHGNHVFWKSVHTRNKHKTLETSRETHNTQHTTQLFGQRLSSGPHQTSANESTPWRKNAARTLK